MIYFNFRARPRQILLSDVLKIVCSYNSNHRRHGIPSYCCWCLTVDLLRNMKCTVHDLEAICSNPDRVKLGCIVLLQEYV